MLFVQDQWFVLLFCLMPLAGCGGGDVPFEFGDVSGTVKYKDGSDITGFDVSINFNPVDKQPIDGNYPQSAYSPVEGGSFTLHTRQISGAVVGKHDVVLVIQPGQETDITSIEVETVEVTSGNNHFDFLVEKPASLTK